MSTLNRDEVLKILREARDRGATEVHFKVPNRPLFRIDGVLLPQGTVLMTPAGTLQVAQAMLSLANLELQLNVPIDREFSFGINGVGRFQVTIYRQRGSVAIIVQRSELNIPTLPELGFESSVEKLIEGGGLLVVAGGRRRAALMASLIDRFNATNRGFAIVLEDPITYLHRDAMASIAQRGIGTDIETMAIGVRNATRQRPDLLACGEVRDKATAEAVLDAVEHGMLVIAGVAAPKAQDVRYWLTRTFAIGEREDIEQRLTRNLKAVLCIPDGGHVEVQLAPPT